uniref:Uncharacterized protein n=1 Tax=Avena sativa TaxID=4498 RepID=A0ACD5TXV1_AVESA
METLKFDRVEISKKMVEIVEQLKPLCAMVSTILSLELLGSRRTPTQDIAMNRHKTTPNIIDPELLFGRNELKKNIVDGIAHGIYCTNKLTVVPLVGPGGIGKTTLTQHIYRELQGSFQVSAWICVSLDFNADRLVQEIVKQIPKVDNEKDNASNQELIEHRLKSKRLLLVLDDMWTYHEDEWKKLLAPLRGEGGEKGHAVIVTTRIPKVASMVTTNNSPINVERLGDKDIMDFFQICVFGDQTPWEDDPRLHDVGKTIVKKLKGFPLAAKTVGRLLRNQLTLRHWTRVAESKEWELQTGDNDIMPALKLSYDYLPFHLQQCFSNCALFPEDYKFGRKEIVHFWIGLDIVHSRDQGKTIEVVALSYLNELVNHGFFKKNENHYVIHDLLHDLALKVSSYECLSICSSNVRSIHVPASVRHMSIIVDNTDVMDLISFKNYKSYLSTLGERLKVHNLRTLMLFGGYHGNFVKIFRGLFREARALRAIFLSGASYSVDDLLLNFSNLVHLRYLRIKSVPFNKNICLPSALFRSYHLEFIDLENWFGSFGSTSQMSKLIKLRHFLVPKYEPKLHSSIFEAGKLKFLQELRRFEVGNKETKGFELSQLGELSELGGSLGIYNLEKVQKEDEANAVKLIHKNNLRELELRWANSGLNRDAKHEENVLESMVPHKNLQGLCIQGHRGSKCPSWLGRDLSVENLESLSLRDVSWNKLPPLGDMWFVDDLGVECQGLSSTLSFQCLKTLQLVKIPGLKKWVGNGTCHLFSHLEVIGIEDCPELVELPFSHPACYQAEQEANMIWFPKLQDLKIIDCPKLSSLPPIPWTPSPCSVEISDVGCEFKNVSYSLNDEKELFLGIEGKGGQNGTLWNVLNFHNLADLEVLDIKNCPPMPLILLQRLTSLKTLGINGMSTVLLLFEGESHNVGCPLPVERIDISISDANGEELTQLLSYFPKLTKLFITKCEKITGLGVVEHQPTVVAAVSASSSANKSEHAQDGHNRQQTRGEDEIASETQGLLLLPPQLQRLGIYACAELRLLSNSLRSDSTRGGLQSLCSLRMFQTWGCPKLLSSFSSSASSCFPFPTSLTELDISGCQDLRGEGLWPLVTQGRLTELRISRTANFFTGSELPLPHDEERRSYSSKIKSLETDDHAGVLTLPICSLLSSSLTKLTFSWDIWVERFTEEQEEALHLLNSLQELQFSECHKLQCLPAGVTKLTNLKRLQIRNCYAIQLLPKDGLPSSLQELAISHCPSIKSLPKECLPSSLQKLEIYYCLAIKSLPEDALQSSLRELHVYGSNMEELRRQCHELKGTIPIVTNYRTQHFY